jgi:hypothetical protein
LTFLNITNLTSFSGKYQRRSKELNTATGKKIGVRHITC